MTPRDYIAMLLGLSRVDYPTIGPKMYTFGDESQIVLNEREWSALGEPEWLNVIVRKGNSS